MSECRALKLAGMSPSVLRYDGNAQLRAEIVALAHRHRRHGYRMLHLWLCQKSWRVNIKRVRRLYREENLMVQKHNPANTKTGLTMCMFRIVMFHAY